MFVCGSSCRKGALQKIRIVISVSSVTSPRIVFVAVVVSQKSENLRKLWKSSKSLTDQMSHRSQVGSLCSVVKTLIVSWVRQTDRQGHLLSCSGQLKTLFKVISFWTIWPQPYFAYLAF